MAFWNSKKKEETESTILPSVVDEDLLKRIEESIRLSTESRDHAATTMARSLNEVTKALNKTTSELMRRK